MKKNIKSNLYSFILVKMVIRLFIFMIVSFSMVWGNISLDGYLHPGDNDLNSFMPIEPLTKKVTSGSGRWRTTENEHTYDYYTDNPTRFYLSQVTELTGVSLQDPEGIDGKLYIWIDGDIVATGNSGESTVDFSFSLSKGYHSIAITGDCYLNGSQVSCSDNHDDIDDFNFSGITLLTVQTTSAYHFIQRRHIGDNNDDDDNYDIDETSYSYYPDAYEAQSVTYDINDANNYAGFEIYLSRVRDIYQDKINKIILYDTNGGVITSFDLDTSSTYTFDFNALYENNISNIGYITISSGKSDLGDYDDISFGELIFIPLSSEDLQDRKKPIIDYHMDECSWDNDSNTYEIKNYGILGSDYNATALNNANTILEGVLCSAADINSTTDDDKAIIAKNGLALSSSYILTTWIKFPLNTDGHNIFGRGRNRVKYFNIADRVSSNKDYIYFAQYINNDSWTLNIADDDNTDYLSFNPQSLSGWHMLTFVITDSGTDFYLDDSKINTFSTHPNTGNLGLLFNSDFDGNDNVPNGQSIGADADEFKIFDQVLSDSDIQTIYNNEKSGKNWDGTPRTCYCEDKNESKNYKFDAWDTFRSITDRNISTEIVNKDFTLVIASLDENGTNFQEFNGTVCAKIDNNTSKLYFTEQNTTNATFKISRAIKDIRVELSWKKDIDESCPLQNEDNSTISTDNFAIRPNNFTIENISSPIHAGSDFNITFRAVDIDDTNVTDYDESKGVSFEVNATEIKSTCKTGNFFNNFNFTDGSASNINTTYSEVGEINTTIQEINGREFAYVDIDDTNDSKRFIEPFAKKLTVLPHHFKIDANLSNFNNENFTYFSKDLNISAILDINITAQNEQNQTTKNYNSACYAKDIDINISSNTRSDLPTMIYIYRDAKDTNSTLLYGDINVAYKDGNFTIDNNGSTNVRFFINYNRERNNSLNPFKLNVTDINVTDINDTFGNAKPDNNATFYYGRVKTKDITTNKKSIDNSLQVEVYKLGKYHQNSLNWYTNEDDNITNIVSLVPQEKFIYNTDTNKSGLNIDKNSSLKLSSGVVSFDINNTWDKSDNSYIHIKIPTYLWYSKYQDYNSSGDCSEHPCFIYTYQSQNNKNNISSGTFIGSSIGDDYNATKVKRGVKTFR